MGLPGKPIHRCSITVPRNGKPVTRCGKFWALLFLGMVNFLLIQYKNLCRKWFTIPRNGKPASRNSNTTSSYGLTVPRYGKPFNGVPTNNVIYLE